MSRRDDEFEERLAELESTLVDLRSQLRQTEPPRPRLRPPTPREVLRFTDEYTIPTVIAILEANIRALELLQRFIRLSDPTRSGSADAARNRLGDVSDEAMSQMSRTLADLQTALSEADLPEDPESRSIIQDARRLSSDIESRIDESRRGGRDRRDRSGRGDRDDRGERSRGERDDGSVSVPIEVTDPDEDGEPNDRETRDPETGVDIESELQSIKDEIDRESDENPFDDGTGSDGLDDDSEGESRTNGPNGSE